LPATDVKVLQFRPRDFAAPSDQLSRPEIHGCLTDETQLSKSAAHDELHDELAGAPACAPSAGTSNISPVPAPRTVRKTTVTIKQKSRAKKPSPVNVLARAANRSRSAKEPLIVLERILDQRDPAEMFAPAVRSPKCSPAANSSTDFWQIWLQHRDYLRARSLRFSSGNSADAEDALSEAMLKAAQSFQNTAVHNHRAWLLRLVHNACMDRHRSNRRLNRLAQDITEADAVSAPAVAIQPDRSPEELLQAIEQIGDLKRAMSALPAFLADPLLRYLDDQSDTEIAGTLKVTKEVIRKRRQIARALLRRQVTI
jgi:RNA polymerase sigma factor (sigma-70 family)